MRRQTKSGFLLKDYKLFSKYKWKEYYGLQEQILSIDWNANGEYLASGGSNLMLFNIKKNSQITWHGTLFDQPQPPITKVKFLNLSMLASLNANNINIWDLRQKSKPLVENIQVKENNTDLISFDWLLQEPSPHLTVLQSSNKIKNYDLRKLSSPISIILPKIKTQCLTWSDKYKALFCGGSLKRKTAEEGSIAIYGHNLNEIEQSLVVQSTRITSIAIPTSSQQIALLSLNSLAGIYSLPDFLNERTYSLDEQGTPIDLSFNHTNEYLAIATGTRDIVIVNVKNGGISFRLICRSYQRTIAWNPHKNILAYPDYEFQKKHKYHINLWAK